MVQEVKFNLFSLPQLQLEGAMLYLYAPDKMTHTTIAKPGCKRVLVGGNHYILENQKCFFKSSKTRTWRFYLMTSVHKKQNDSGYRWFLNPLMNFSKSVNTAFRREPFLSCTAPRRADCKDEGQLCTNTGVHLHPCSVHRPA